MCKTVYLCLRRDKAAGLMGDMGELVAQKADVCVQKLADLMLWISFYFDAYTSCQAETVNLCHSVRGFCRGSAEN